MTQAPAALNRVNIKAHLRAVWMSRLNTTALGGFAVAIISLLALVWRLSSLTAGKISASELATKHQLFTNSPWWKSIANIYGPYYLILHATFAINRNAWSLRLASLVSGIVCVFLVYWLVTQWHGLKIGLLAASVAILNFGQLAIARNATPLSTQPLMTIALLAAINYLSNRRDPIGLIPLLLAVVFSLYIPGGIWVALVAQFIALPDVKDAISNLTAKSKVIVASIGLIVLAPLIYRLGFHYSLSQFKNWLGYGLNGKPLHALHALWSNLIATPLDITIRSINLGPNLSLGHLPALPIVFSLLALIGLVIYVTRFKNWRWRAVIYLIGICWLTSGLGIINPLAILPLLAVCAGTGMAYLLKQWFSVFPRNRFARNFGTIVMTAVILFSGIYGFRSYIVAWGNNPKTISIYSHSLN